MSETKEKSRYFLGFIRIPDFDRGPKNTRGCEKGNCFCCSSIHETYCTAKVEIAYHLYKLFNKIKQNKDADIDIQRTHRCERELSPQQIIYRAHKLQYAAEHSRKMANEAIRKANEAELIAIKATKEAMAAEEQINAENRLWAERARHNEEERKKRKQEWENKAR